MMDSLKKNLKVVAVQAGIIGIVAAGLAGGLVYLFLRSSELSVQVSKLRGDNDRLLRDKKKMEGLLEDSKQELTLAAKQNFRDDLVVAQNALRDANQKLAEALRNKAMIENTSLTADSRLKSMTGELTKTLEELKDTRHALAGIDAQYRTKLLQVTDNLKLKEDQLNKLGEKIRQKEMEVQSYQGQTKQHAERVTQFQKNIAESESVVAGLQKKLEEKEKQLAVKTSQLEEARLITARSSAASVSNSVSVAKLSALEKERIELERQVSGASARIFDMSEQLKESQGKLAEAKAAADDRDRALVSKEYELDRYRKEVEAMKNDIRSLKAGATDMSVSSAVFSEQKDQLVRRVRDLEREKANLEEQVSHLQGGAGASVKGDPQDPYLNMNFRVLAESLVKKEQEIQSMQDELDVLRREKRGWDSGDKVKRLGELELLTTTLTKQLGDYVAMIQKKDAALKESAQKIADLEDEFKIQKVEALTIRKDLVEARSRQEKTFESLSQIMGTNNTVSSSAPSSVPELTAVIEELPEAANDADVKKNIDELRRRVEVMLRSK
jgi:chromosome segregation ATPase